MELKLSATEERLVKQHREELAAAKAKATSIIEAKIAEAEKRLEYLRGQLSGKYKPMCTCDQQWTNPNCLARLMGHDCD